MRTTIRLRTLPHTTKRHLTLPRILHPTFWTSLIPKPLLLRPSTSPRAPNPATPYIILGLLVGSQAIQTLWLKQDRGQSLRRAEAKLALLKEVLGRVQAGEDVDVDRVLGTGDLRREVEWGEMLKQFGKEEELFQNKKKRKALRRAAEGEEEEEKRREGKSGNEGQQEEGKVKVESVGGVKFY